MDDLYENSEALDEVITIICSRADKASINIKERLIEIMGDYSISRKDNMCIYSFYNFKNIVIVEIKDRLIYADYIDKIIEDKFKIKIKEILFASRHSSKDKRKLLSCHVSGNVGTALYGGKVYSLAKPSPHTMKNYSIALFNKIRSAGLDYVFSLEVTHHGPSEIEKPSAFYEIGSTEREWEDKEAAEIVAESMLEAIAGRDDWTVAVGIGGTHYAPRQTEIELNTTIAFAHNFAKYTFEAINSEFLKKAIEISDADIVVVDEKSTKSKIKEMVRKVCDSVGIEMLKSKTVKKEFKLDKFDKLG